MFNTLARLTCNLDLSKKIREIDNALLWRVARTQHLYSETVKADFQTYCRRAQTQNNPSKKVRTARIRREGTLTGVKSNKIPSTTLTSCLRVRIMAGDGSKDQAQWYVECIVSLTPKPVQHTDLAGT